MLHLDTWEESPGQGRPLFEGVGLLHRRVRVCSPPPQGAEHSLQACHGPQFPSTTDKGVNKRIFIRGVPDWAANYTSTILSL